ncbi:MAG: methylmalonyl-CoA mutase, partial [Thermoplasmatales archaeon]|nr:methylmalonyl-CoA mutase [Thermoplasmatales archaeon]
GLSLLSGAHMTLFVDVTRLLKEKGMEDVLVVGGGIIPEDDAPKLKEAGVAGVFGPGTRCDDIVKFIKKNVTR